ncbi:hypothetical protein BH10BDE1_BH10BDE1_16630 [soil metagenome]
MNPKYAAIHKFICDIAQNQRRQVVITETTELIESQILDSVSLVRLILVIQDQFGLEVSFADLDRRNFTDLATIGETIERLKRARD